MTRDIPLFKKRFISSSVHTFLTRGYHLSKDFRTINAVSVPKLFQSQTEKIKRDLPIVIFSYCFYSNKITSKSAYQWDKNLKKQWRSDFHPALKVQQNSLLSNKRNHFSTIHFSISPYTKMSPRYFNLSPNELKYLHSCKPRISKNQSINHFILHSLSINIRRHYSNNIKRKNPYEFTPLPWHIRFFIYIKKNFFRFFSWRLYIQSVYTAPAYKRHMGRFIVLVLFFILILFYGLLLPNSIINLRKNPNRGRNMGWNGSVDEFWKEAPGRYIRSSGNILVASILGGNDDELSKMLCSIFPNQPSINLNADMIMYMITSFDVPKHQLLHVGKDIINVNYSKEQNQRYENYLDRIFMNLNHSFPFFLYSLYASDPKDVLSVCKFVRKRLATELLPGETIVMPLYTQANLTKDIRGPHRSYLSFKLKENDTGPKLIDLSIYDTRTIHWAFNPKGIDHKDESGYVRVDYNDIPLDENFHKKLYTFLVQVERFPNGNYKTDIKQSPLRNYSDYKNIAFSSFGQIGNVSPEKHKLSKYDYGAWDALENVLRDWSNGDKEVYYRLKMDLRRFLSKDTMFLMLIPNYKDLLKTAIQRQIEKDETKFYNYIHPENVVHDEEEDEV